MSNSFKTINYEYPKPINFDANDKVFNIFKKFQNDDCFTPRVEKIKNARISTNSVIFNYFKIYKESCINDINYKRYSDGFRFYLKYIFPKLNFSKKPFIVITDEWTSNYYHWHAYSLKRLITLKEKGLIEDSLIFLPKKYQKYKFVLPCLEKFGISKKQIVFLPKKSNIKVKEALFAIAPRQHPEMFEKIRDTLTKDANHHPGFGERIYISREGQVLRFIENEQEVVTLLEKYGFKKVIIDQFSYLEQISICNKAKYLIGPHGAGLTNTLFMKDGSSVLEMATDQSKSYNRDFYALSTMLGLNYFYQECEMGPNSPKMDFHQGSLVVDLAKLEENLKLMLKNE